MYKVRQEFYIIQTDFTSEWEVYLQGKKGYVDDEIGNVEQSVSCMIVLMSSWDISHWCLDWTGMVVVPAIGWWTGDPQELLSICILQCANTHANWVHEHWFKRVGWKSSCIVEGK